MNPKKKKLMNPKKKKLMNPKEKKLMNLEKKIVINQTRHKKPLNQVEMIIMMNIKRKKNNQLKREQTLPYHSDN
jgi:hypothetical protein